MSESDDKDKRTYFSSVQEQLSATVGEPLCSIGQAYSKNAETGLAYNRFRYYDPNIGAYISQDPIGLRRE